MAKLLNILDLTECPFCGEDMIIPTEPGKLLYKFLEENANWLIDVDHTKKFEEDLDKIEQGEDSMQLIEEM